MNTEAALLVLFVVLVALVVIQTWRLDTERTRRLMAEDHCRAQAEAADAAVRQAEADRATANNAVHANAELAAQRDAARRQLRQASMGRN